jgi:hypothetical protein
MSARQRAPASAGRCSSRPRLQLGAEGFDLLLGGRRPDQHAVAAGAMHLLHHQFVQVIQHVLQILTRLRQQRHVGTFFSSGFSPV